MDGASRLETQVQHRLDEYQYTLRASRFGEPDFLQLLHLSRISSQVESTSQVQFTTHSAPLFGDPDRSRLLPVAPSLTAPLAPTPPQLLRSPLFFFFSQLLSRLLGPRISTSQSFLATAHPCHHRHRHRCPPPPPPLPPPRCLQSRSSLEANAAYMAPTRSQPTRPLLRHHSRLRPLHHPQRGSQHHHCRPAGNVSLAANSEAQNTY